MFFIFFSYRISESNWYVLIGRQILSLLCLPISPILHVTLSRRPDSNRHNNVLQTFPLFHFGHLDLWAEYGNRTHISTLEGSCVTIALIPLLNIRDSRIANRHLHEHKDSNPDLRFWRPTFYHWTMDVCHSIFDQVQGIEPWIDLIARQAVCFIIGLVFETNQLPICWYFTWLWWMFLNNDSLYPDLESNQEPTD